MSDYRDVAVANARAEFRAQAWEEGLSPFDCESIGLIVAGHGTWFQADLIRLCARADSGHLARLALAYPATVRAYLQWREGNRP